MARKKSDKRQFWITDAETDPFKRWRTPDQQRIPKPFIWGLYTGASMHFFKKTEELIDCIKDNDVIVGAHNGGKFDFHLRSDTTSLLDHINTGEDMKIINGRLVSAKIGRAEIRDTFNLFPAPLRTFANKLEIDYRKLEADVRHKHMPEIKRYLTADCVELWKRVDEFERQYGRHLTQAGAAMAQWRKISGAEQPKTDARYFAKFRPYYYGGRVQCFERGYIKGPIHVRDIRSAYPFAMLSAHPYDPTYFHVERPETCEPQDMVTLDCISSGALPYKDHRGSITFPRDNVRRRYKVTGWEVLAAVETGALREVELIDAVRFIGCRDFKPYINHFYEARKVFRTAGDEGNTYFAKILMNSLYGKFGANPDNYGNFMVVPWDEKLDHEQDGYYFNGKLGQLAVVRRDLDPWQQHFINVATAASVTGFVRAYLWRELNAADSPVYCDTDCIFARGFRPDMPIGEELGEWAHEGTAKELWLAGKKTYYAKGDFGKGSDGKPKIEKMAAKGVRPDRRAIKAAALGRTVAMKNAAPTFTLSGQRGVYFQERRIRMTAAAGEAAERPSPAEMQDT